MLVGVTYVLYSLDPRLFLNSRDRAGLPLHPARGHRREPGLPGGGRHAHAVLQPPARADVRRLRAGGARPAAGRAGQRRADHERQHDRQPDRPAHHGGDRPDHRRRRRPQAGDGADGSGANQGFLKNTPVEINEAEVPIRVLRYGLAQDSAGPGLHRGGLGTELIFRALSPNTRVTARNRDRTVFTGWGIAGGRAGAPSRLRQEPGPTGRGEPGQHRHRPHRAGRRDPRHLAAAPAAGATRCSATRRPCCATSAAAGSRPSRRRADYGVVDRATARSTTRRPPRCAPRWRATGRRTASTIYGPAREAFEAVWTDANYDALTECLASAAGALALLRQAPDLRRHRRRCRTAPERTDGTAVRRLHAEMLAEFPELRRLAAE